MSYTSPGTYGFSAIPSRLPCGRFTIRTFTQLLKATIVRAYFEVFPLGGRNVCSQSVQRHEGACQLCNRTTTTLVDPHLGQTGHSSDFFSGTHAYNTTLCQH